MLTFNNHRHPTRRAVFHALWALLLCIAPSLFAQTPLEQVFISSDIQSRIYEDASQTVTINANDNSTFVWNASGTNNAVGEFHSPPATDPVDIAGYNRFPRWFAIDISLVIDGVLIQPGDVVQVNASLTDPVIVFDGSANALPAGVNIDAVTIDPATGDIVLSFDRSVGGSPLFRRADLVRWTGSVYELYFQGSMLPVHADINGAHILDSGNILMTFQSGIMVPGTGGSFYVRNDQVVEYDPDTELFSMTAVDLNSHPSWRRAGFDALAAVEAGDGLFADRFED